MVVVIEAEVEMTLAVRGDDASNSPVPAWHIDHEIVLQFSFHTFSSSTFFPCETLVLLFASVPDQSLTIGQR